MDDKKSRNDFLFFFNKGVIAWSSQRQDCTTSSTTEVEYVAACNATKEAIWLRRLLSSIRLEQTNASVLFSITGICSAWCETQSFTNAQST